MENEKEVLLSQYKHSKDVKESIRSHAILLVKSGHSQTEVAKLFYVDEETIRNWLAGWDARREVTDKPRSGRPRKITKGVEEEICRLVDENKPEKEEMHTSAWDCRELKIWLMDKYGIEMTREQIRKILKKNGFRYKKMNHKFNKANEEKRKEFLDEFKELHSTINGTLIFEDEMASKLHPNKGYIWTREKKPVIETDCSHEKTYVIGGVSPDTGETYTLTNEKFNSNTFIAFLTLLLSSIKGDILLVKDNHPSHHSKTVREFLEKHPRIKSIFLPEYSPDLNPKENFWNYLRNKFLNNKLFKTVDEMAIGIKSFIASIPRETVKSICSYDYLLG